MDWKNDKTGNMETVLILGEHNALLRNKGFTEQNVASSAKPGTLGAELRQKFYETYNAVTPEHPNKWFRINLVGKLFKADDIRYQFNYCYDLRLKYLLLASVETHYKDLWKVAVFNRPEDCPTVKELNTMVRPKSLRRKPLKIRKDNNTKGIRI
jgi:hypothetical protein